MLSPRSEFDRVTNLKGRPRGSNAFATNPRAPQLMAPLPLVSRRVIPATQLVIPASQPPANAEPVTSGQPASSRGSRGGRGRGSRGGRGRGSRGCRGSSRGHGRAGSVMPSLRREPSEWENVDLSNDGPQVSATPTDSEMAGNQSSTPSGSRGRGSRSRGARGGIIKRISTGRVTRQASNSAAAAQIRLGTPIPDPQ